MWSAAQAIKLEQSLPVGCIASITAFAKLQHCMFAQQALHSVKRVLGTTRLKQLGPDCLTYSSSEPSR